uniref:Taste receptor type 2 n=1 Tax=Apteryx owenii TaxID=8824 RepID=A0A8B9QBW6_APTOW
MPTLFSLIFLIIAIIESMAGLLGNGTILAVSSTSWVRSKILSFYDMIMIFLSLYRFCLQSWMMLDLFLSLFYAASYYVDNLFVTFKIVFMFLNYSSLWFAAWLSIFCCTKVATFTQSFFIWLKQRMSSFDIYNVHDNFTTPLTVTNFSERRAKMKTSLFLLILLCKAGVALPLTVFVVSGILLIRSLWRHTRHAHMDAIKSVFFFLILYVTYFIALFFILSNMFLPFSIWEAIGVAVMAACPAGHSTILIWSNPKFRELPARILFREQKQVISIIFRLIQIYVLNEFKV